MKKIKILKTLLKTGDTKTVVKELVDLYDSLPKETVEGAPGKDGPRGETGPKGEKGDKGDPGEPGKDGKSVELEDVVDELRHDVLRRNQGSGNMNRDIKINGSVLSYYGDVNFIGSIAGVPNQTTKYTDVYFSGGGGTPAAPDTAVQFNDGGSFGGSSHFTFTLANDTINLGVVGDEAGISAPSAVDPDTQGGALFFQGGDGTGDSNGGYLGFVTGTGGLTGNGGQLSFDSGNGGATSGDAGNIFLTGGNATDGSGGDIFLSGGNSSEGAGGVFSASAGETSNGNGGYVEFIAGNSNGGNGNGGDVKFTTGRKNGAGTAGKFTFTPSGGSTVSGILDFDSLVTTNKTFTFPNVSGTVAAPVSVASAGMYLLTTGGGLSQWASVVSSGGFTRTTSIISVSSTIAAAASTDYVIFANVGIQTVLPTAIGNTNRYTIKNYANSSVLVTTTAGQTIDDSDTALLSTKYQSLDLISNGSIWGVI